MNKIHGFSFIELRIVLRVRRRAPKNRCKHIPKRLWTWRERPNRRTERLSDAYDADKKQHEDYYRKLGTPLGVPKVKSVTADPENTHEGYNTIIKGLGGHCVPDVWK